MKRSENGTVSKLFEYDMQNRINRFNKKPGEMTGYDCPVCRNKGLVMSLKDGKEIVSECRCIRVRTALKKSGMSELIRDKRFDGFEAVDAWQKTFKTQMQKFAENPSGWLLVCGQSGSGKTHLCFAVAGSLIERGIPVTYMPWRDDVVKLKANVVKNHEEYQRQIDVLKHAQVLYIDDLFKGSSTEGDLNVAFELINYRYAANLTTIISTKKNPKELEKIDEDLTGRIKEKSGENVIWIANDPDKNYRTKQKKYSGETCNLF